MVKQKKLRYIKPELETKAFVFLPNNRSNSEMKMGFLKVTDKIEINAYQNFKITE